MNNLVRWWLTGLSIVAASNMKIHGISSIDDAIGVFGAVTVIVCLCVDILKRREP